MKNKTNRWSQIRELVGNQKQIRYICNSMHTTSHVFKHCMVSEWRLVIYKTFSISQIVRVARSLVYDIVFCRSLLVPLTLVFLLFFWPLHCLPFFDFGFRLHPLVSSYFSNTSMSLIYTQYTGIWNKTVLCFTKSIWGIARTK